MFCGFLPDHRYVVEGKGRVVWLVTSGREDDLHCLFAYIGVEDHFQLLSPRGDFIEIFREEMVGRVYIGNSYKRRKIGGSSVKVTLQLIERIISSF